MRKIPREYENPIDNVVYDLAEWSAPFYKSLNMTPNHITTLSLIFGLLSSYFLYKGDSCTAAVLFLVSYYYDNTDGLYARKYKMTTKYGDIYDHVADIVKGVIMIWVMSKVNKDKLVKWLPIMAIFFVLSLIHLGCQEQYYDSKEDRPFMDLLKKLCPDKSYLKCFRWVGNGTLILVVALIMLDF